MGLPRRCWNRPLAGFLCLQCYLQNRKLGPILPGASVLAGVGRAPAPGKTDKQRVKSRWPGGGAGTRPSCHSTPHDGPQFPRLQRLLCVSSSQCPRTALTLRPLLSSLPWAQTCPCGGVWRRHLGLREEKQNRRCPQGSPQGGPELLGAGPSARFLRSSLASCRLLREAMAARAPSPQGAPGWVQLLY